MDRFLAATATALGYAVLALMAILVIGSIFARRGGSLDPLTAGEIKAAVERA
jgi:TRAP-type C4-dicarboxylate transport system permease small subunit